MTTIYVKEDLGAKKESYYFTDGVNLLSKQYTFKGMLERARFLISLGIKVESTMIDINYYLN
jgi:hypothetical protein